MNIIAHNPGRYTDAQLEQIFVARQREFAYFMEKIASVKTSEAPQHLLLYGQRGMGKSTLLHRLAAELRKADFNKIYLPLTFPEEQYNVNTLQKFWLNCLDALADALEQSGRQQLTDELDADIQQISQGKSEIAPNKIFNRWCKKLSVRAVLLVDNIDLIFSKISKAERHQLRAQLMRPTAPILIGGSVAELTRLQKHDEPFYDFFIIHQLRRLDFAAAKAVLTNLARLQNNQQLLQDLEQHPGRLRTLYELTGGSPRTMTLLYPILVQGFGADIYQDLEALLDSVTPLYKARFEELTAAQMQTVLDAVALAWKPVSLEQLRQTTQLANPQLSPQLKRLVAAGWLITKNTHDTRGKRYEVAERLFNVWYLMRRSSRRQRREIQYLTYFLEHFYGEDLAMVGSNLANKAIRSEQDVTYRLAMAGGVRKQNSVLAKQLENDSYRYLLDNFLQDESLLQRFDIPEQYILHEIKLLQDEALVKLSNKASVYEVAKRLYVLMPTNIQFIYIWASELLNNKQYQESKEKYEKVLSVDKTHSGAWNGMGNLYQVYLNQYEKAETAYKKAIQCDASSAQPWNGLGNLYQSHLNKFSKAEEAYLNATRINKNYIEPWFNLGKLYKERLKDFSKAEKSFKKVTQLNNNDVEAWYQLGNLYLYDLNQPVAATKAYNKAIEIDSEHAMTWYDLGNLYRLSNQFEKARDAYNKAIEIQSDNAYAWHNIGNLYQIYFHQYDEAEKAYKKAIQIDNSLAYAWDGIGDLYAKHLFRFDDSKRAYIKAIQLDSEYPNPWNGLGNLYQDQLKQFDKAKQAYKKAIQLGGDSESSISNLIFLLRDNLQQIEEAKEWLSKLAKTDLKFPEIHTMHHALFHFYKQNIGLAQSELEQMLTTANGIIRPNVQDDWLRFAAVILRNNWTTAVLQNFQATGYHQRMRPYYEAITALTHEKPYLYINSIPAEMREVTTQLVKKIEHLLAD